MKNMFTWFITVFLYCVIANAQALLTPELITNIGSRVPLETRVLALGDPTHQESTITKHRIALIKQLVLEEGYKIIALEGNLYELYSAYQAFLSTQDVSLYDRAMYSQLNATEMDELYYFVQQQNEQGNKVKLVGFDGALSGTTLSHCIERKLVEVNTLSAIEKESFVNAIEKASISNLSVLFRNNKKIKSTIVSYSEQVLEQFVVHTDDDAFFAQTLANFIAMYKEDSSDISNSRDVVMASNVKFLLDRYADEKIVLFGSSTHFIKSPKSIKTTFFQNNRITLGMLLAQSIGDKYAFIAYSALSGEKFSMFKKAVPLSDVAVNAIEEQYLAISDSAVYLSKNEQEAEGLMYCRMLGHSFVEMNLWEVVDGLVLIKDVKPFVIRKGKK